MFQINDTLKSIPSPEGFHPYEALIYYRIQHPFYYNFAFIKNKRKKNTLVPIKNESDWKLAVQRALIIDGNDGLPATPGVAVQEEDDAAIAYTNSVSVDLLCIVKCNKISARPQKATPPLAKKRQSILSNFRDILRCL